MRINISFLAVALLVFLELNPHPVAEEVVQFTVGIHGGHCLTPVARLIQRIITIQMLQTLNHRLLNGIFGQKIRHRLVLHVGIQGWKIE